MLATRAALVLSEGRPSVTGIRSGDRADLDRPGPITRPQASPRETP
ncbi:MAG: hypothetical protein ACREQ5_38925 [Candidatus Dormibacteria bacterium]